MEPLPPLPGIPTLEPGWDEITTPEPLALPPSFLGGARTEPESPGPPRPTPFLPEPDSPGPEPMEGGGGTTLLANCVPLPEAPEFPEPLEPPPEPLPEPPPEFPTDGGGGITLDTPTVDPGTLPAVELLEPPIEGGGGTTPAASEPPGAPVALRAVPEPTEGGGGTTLLASEPL
jgi:hypothetical protein